MSLEVRKFNVVAFLAIACVLTYLGVFAAGWLLGRITLEEFRTALLPLLTSVLGYMAKALEGKS